MNTQFQKGDMALGVSIFRSLKRKRPSLYIDKSGKCELLATFRSEQTAEIFYEAMRELLGIAKEQEREP